MAAIFVGCGFGRCIRALLIYFIIIIIIIFFFFHFLLLFQEWRNF